MGAISTTECPIPRDLAQGPDGLYLAGHRNISAYECAPNGSFIRHLNLPPSSLELSFFTGICFDTTSGCIVACDQSFGVYVFTTSGECVCHQ